MTMLQPGELLIRKGAVDLYLAITGGFLEVRPDRIIILADAAERAEDIDVSRAEEAKRRAEERLHEQKDTGIDMSGAEAAMRRALVRLKAVERRKKRRREGRTGG